MNEQGCCEWLCVNESNCFELNLLEDFVVCGMLAIGDTQVEVLNQRHF